MNIGSKGRVRSDSGLNLREKPNGNKVTVLANNEEVEILQEIKFYRVKTRHGTVGYVHGDYIENSPSLNEIDGQNVVEDMFPDPEFKLVTFKGDCFIGEPALVDDDFAYSLKRVNQFAKDCGVKIWVTSSTRNINEQVNGAIVTPAGNSCHHIGHAIDMNIMFKGQLYNSKKLRKSNLKNLPAAIKDFIDLIRKDETLRWGGDFTVEDPVHIDDNFYHRQKMMYSAKLHSRVDQLNA